MKKAASNHAPSKLEDELHAATTKAQYLEKAAQLTKDKAGSAKRHFKQARKAFKQAKRSAKRAAKLARRAHEELKVCVEKVAKEKKRTAMLARRAAARKPANGALAATTGAPKRKLKLANAIELPPSTQAVAAAVEPQPPSEAPVPAAAAATKAPHVI